MSRLPAAEDYVKLFTDGACSGNPGPGGWAFILEHPASGKILERFGAEPHTTNNRMEIEGALRGLETLKRPCRVELITDSQYLAKGINEWLPGWRANGYRRREGNKLKPLVNDDLWRAVDALLAKHQVRVVHVKGHAGHPQNERCDQLAVAAYKSLGRRPPVPTAAPTYAPDPEFVPPHRPAIESRPQPGPDRRARAEIVAPVVSPVEQPAPLRVDTPTAQDSSAPDAEAPHEQTEILAAKPKRPRAAQPARKRSVVSKPKTSRPLLEEPVDSGKDGQLASELPTERTGPAKAAPKKRAPKRSRKTPEAPRDELPMDDTPSRWDPDEIYD